MPILTPALVQLRADFNEIAPNRDKATDGWIGDPRHQQYPSGHNPDESGNAERQDADNIDEVRAIDVDKDLRQPGVTMLACIRRILATPEDRRRLIYIIYMPPGGVSTIWTKSSGWQAHRYTGSNPHDKHAHFSGDPAYDHDDRPWSIKELIMPLDNTDITKIKQTVRDVLNEDRPYVGTDTTGPRARIKALGWSEQSLNSLLDYMFEFHLALRSKVETLGGDVDEIRQRDFTNEPEIVAGVLTGLSPEALGAAITAAGLTPEAIAAAIPDEIGNEVIDALDQRLSGPST